MPTLPNYIVMLHHHTDKHNKQRVMIRVVVDRKSKYLRNP
jgi:hypothetical protein